MLYTMAIMAIFTALIGLIMLGTRIAAVKSGTVKPRYFKYMQGTDLPEIIITSGRNFSNQFEVPILFYVVATLYIMLGIENTTALMLAWAFVVSRIAHTVIHLTYNHVIHRMLVFLFGFGCVIGLWINLLILKN